MNITTTLTKEAESHNRSTRSANMTKKHTSRREKNQNLNKKIVLLPLGYMSNIIKRKKVKLTSENNEIIK